MKNVNKKHPHLRVIDTRQPKYPNAADHNYFAQKALDVTTGIISCIGFVSAMLFLVTMA